MATRKASGRRAAAKKHSKQTQDALVPPTRATSAGSATGQALRIKDEDIPKGKDRGSKVPIEGGVPKSDKDSKPVGAQAEPARFVSNGQLEHFTVPTASGPVTAPSVEAHEKVISDLDRETAARLQNRQSNKRLSAETVNRLGRPELRAIAVQRGYEVPEAGTRSTRAAFITAQDKDKTVED